MSVLATSALITGAIAALRGTWSTAATLTSPALNTVPIERTQIRVK